jgi:gamma-glutamylcyclotransferase (GGCT)/AIG2-like uncharacterized protein YtfP
MAAPMLVALYGTLKVGHVNHERYLKGERPTSALFAELPFEMFTNEEYPMLVPAASGELHRVWVEIFDVSDEQMRELDALETPYGYWRESVFIDALGETVAIYVHPAPPPDGFTRVPSGMWPP